MFLNIPFLSSAKLLLYQIMGFGKIREKSVKIGKDRKLSKNSGCLPENDR